MDVKHTLSLGHPPVNGSGQSSCPGQAAPGLTLIELLAAIAIFAILFGIGFPSLSSMFTSARLTSQINLLTGALAFTRSEAIQHNRMVVICKSPDGYKCQTSGHWEDGWFIYIDNNDNREFDKTDQRLRVQAKLTGVTLRYRAFGSRNYIAYRPDGFTQTNGTFTFCVEGKPDINRALILTKSGRVRFNTNGPGGEPLKCP